MNYSEKVTLRLTTQDKQSLQAEADEKKVPLTTLIRNKVSGQDLEDETKEFEPQLIMTDLQTYQLAKHHSNLKLNTVDAVLNEIEKLVPLPDRTSEEFKRVLLNPVQYVTTHLYEKHSKSLSFKISPSKLMELMEIDLRPLNHATTLFMKYNGNIVVDVNGNIKSGVKVETYQHYTKRNDDNKRLKFANEIINILEKTKDYNSSITVGRARDLFNPIIIIGYESQLTPNLAWVLGKR